MRPASTHTNRRSKRQDFSGLPRTASRTKGISRSADWSHTTLPSSVRETTMGRTQQSPHGRWQRRIRPGPTMSISPLPVQPYASFPERETRAAPGLATRPGERARGCSPASDTLRHFPYPWQPTILHHLKDDRTYTSQRYPPTLPISLTADHPPPSEKWQNTQRNLQREAQAGLIPICSPWDNMFPGRHAYSPEKPWIACGMAGKAGSAGSSTSHMFAPSL